MLLIVSDVICCSSVPYQESSSKSSAWNKVVLGNTVVGEMVSVSKASMLLSY